MPFFGGVDSETRKTCLSRKHPDQSGAAKKDVLCRYANDSKAATALKKLYAHGPPLRAALERSPPEARMFGGAATLCVEPLPSGVENHALQCILPANQFANLKFAVLEPACNACECCGEPASELHARYSHSPSDQRLKRLMALCAACHQVSTCIDALGAEGAARHVATVQDITVEQARAEVEQGLRTWRKLGSATWKFTHAQLLNKGAGSLGLAPKFPRWVR